MLLLPSGYDPTVSYATTLYLHQLDNGSNGPQSLQDQINAWFNTSDFRTAHPSIIVAPLLDQNADLSGQTINFGGISTADTDGETNAIAALKQVMSQYLTNPNQVYVTGNSMGGIGTWDMLIKYNAYTGTEGKIFAAGMPLAGADYGQGYPAPTADVVQALKDVPIFAIHGASDTTVPLDWDRNMFAAEQTAGGLMKYTEDASLGHDVWDTYYTQASTWDWLYSQKTGAATPATATLASSAKSTDAVPASITVTPASGTEKTYSAETTATVKAGGDTFSITGKGVASVVLGASAESLRFISMTSVKVTGGTEQVALTADAGTNSFTPGIGALDISGGTGADSYIVHKGAGALTVGDFSAGKGDSLTIDSGLKSAMQSGADSNGGTMISFGGAAGMIDLKGVASLPTAAIHWA